VIIKKIQKKQKIKIMSGCVKFVISIVLVVATAKTCVDQLTALSIFQMLRFTELYALDMKCM
jgi:hypothetical protein